MDSTQAFLGLIKKAGKLEVGEEPVGASCRAHKAQLILIAQDAAHNSVRRAQHFADLARSPMVAVPLDKDQLGQAIGRPPCSMIAVTDIGFAAALIKKLSVQNPAIDPSLCERLAAKSSKTLQRRKEKRAHEKNLLRGKKRQVSRAGEKKAEK